MPLEERGTELLVSTWVFTGLAVLIVALKLFTRAKILQGLGWDDFFVFLSLILLVLCTSIFTYDVHLGMGKHARDIPASQLSDTIKFNYIANPLGIMAYSLPNISIAILLERLLAPNKLRAVFLYSVAVSQCIIAAISCILLFTQCTPTEYLWNPTMPATCISAGTLSKYSYFVGSYTAATDIILGVVPIAAFWNLKIPTRTKVGLCFLMGCTLFAAICAIVKTTKLNTLADLQDFTYATVDLVIWAIVEASVIIVAACIPTLRPFFNKAFAGTQNVSEGRSFFRGIGSFLSFRSLSNRSFTHLVWKRSGNSVSGTSDQEVQDTTSSSRPTIWKTSEFEVV